MLSSGASLGYYGDQMTSETRRGPGLNESTSLEKALGVNRTLHGAQDLWKCFYFAALLRAFHIWPILI